MAVSQSISLTQGVQSIENNTTQVTFTWTSTQTGQSHNDYTRTAHYYVSINGGAETAYSVLYTLPQYATTTIVSKTFTVAHNNDGTGSITVRTWMDTSISAGVVQKSQSLTLTTIPRSSKINSFTGTDLAGSFSVGYTSYSSSFTNKLRISVPNVKSLETFNYTSGASFKLSQTSLDYLYSYMSKTDKVQLGAVIETWSGNTKIGESSELIHDCYAPSNIKPSLGTISLDPANITTADGDSRNILVQGKNKITISVSGCKPGSGSSIKSYTFTVLSGSTTIATNTVTSTSTSASTTFGPFSQTGDFKFRVTVTDNRSRTINNSGSEPVCTCYNYAAPYFSAFNAYRANSDGSPNVNGTYLQCDYTPVYSSVNSTNKATITVHYNEKTSNSSRVNLEEKDATYNVYLTIADNYGGSNKSSTITVFGSSRIFNITADGTGFAIGKMAEIPNGYPGIFESRWPAKFNDDCEIKEGCDIGGNLTVNGGSTINGGLTLGTSTQSSTPIVGITVHDVRDATITPNSFGDRNANFYFDTLNDGRWYSILHMKGWTGNYAAWELAGNAHSSSSDGTLKYRQGVGNTWGEWQTVLTDKSAFLPLSGGTLTGKLTLDNTLLYATNGTGGLDCNDSDIINANGIYFNDSSNSAGESINFYRSSGYWDTLYAAGGALKFHPNRSTSAALGGYTICSTYNFRRGTCTLSSSADTTVTFSSAFNGTPTVILTPLTTAAGVITGKVKSVSTTGFTAIIGGEPVNTALFAYLAVYI